jgi:hypothetical protein
MYLQGQTISLQPGGETVLEGREPYFKRQGDHFCSHSYTPSAKGPTYPVAIAGNHTLIFSHPMFSLYRESAPLWSKKLIDNGIDMLLDKRMVRHNGPSYLSVQVLEQPCKRRYCVHILSYVPIRKSATIDIIEERTKLYDVSFEFSLPQTVSNAYSVMQDINLSIENGKVTMPEIDGYGILVLKVSQKALKSPE